MSRSLNGAREGCLVAPPGLRVCVDGWWWFVRYVAVVRVMDDTTGKTSKLQLDQEDLETVIPKVGGAVRVVNGRGRGCAAQVLAINTDQFCVAVRVSGEGQPLPHGTVLDKVEYEDVCKLEPEVKG